MTLYKTVSDPVTNSHSSESRHDHESSEKIKLKRRMIARASLPFARYATGRLPEGSRQTADGQDLTTRTRSLLLNGPLSRLGRSILAEP